MFAVVELHEVLRNDWFETVDRVGQWLLSSLDPGGEGSLPDDVSSEELVKHLNIYL